jgi:hypothetical protein
MSRLNYASVGEAFMLGSDQIKNTQEEIAKLKALVMESSILPTPEQGPPPIQQPKPPQEYNRIGPSPPVSAVFGAQGTENFDTLLIKLVQHPRFDDIVKNYVSFKHPEWILKETKSGFGSINQINWNDVFFYLALIVIIYLLVN